MSVQHASIKGIFKNRGCTYFSDQNGMIGIGFIFLVKTNKKQTKYLKK